MSQYSQAKAPNIKETVQMSCEADLECGIPEGRECILSASVFVKDCRVLQPDTLISHNLSNSKL